MQYCAPLRALARALVLCLGAAVPCACSSAEPVVYAEALGAAEAAPRFAFYTVDPVLHAAALRAEQRMAAALGETGLSLAPAEAAAACRPFQADCGFELTFADVVYCQGNPDPALGCTAQGARGKALGIELQASLAGEELDNRLIHELFHVITHNRAPHSRDGLFMEYSLGDERISEGTLEAVCQHFSCTRLVAEEGSAEGQ